MAVKTALNRISTAAWTDYFEAVTIQKALQPDYSLAVNQVAEANVALDQLYFQKVQLLMGLKPQAALKVTLSKPFRQDSSLTIRLKLRGAVDPSDPLQVYVGQIHASLSSATMEDYRLPDTKGATPNSQNNLTLMIQ